MSATIVDSEVRVYLDAVRAHLEDLPEDDRAELLEDLEGHLLEVAAEDDGTLEDRLGPPHVYAEELRASAGLPDKHGTRSGRLQRLADRLARSSPFRAATGFAGSSYARSLRAFALDLRPGWWVLRGYLAVVTVALATDDARFALRPFPAVSESYWNGVLLTMGAIVASVWLGRRVQRTGSLRRFSIVLSVAIAAVSVLALAGWDPPSSESDYYGVGYESVPYLHHADGSPIANVCPYSSDGKLFTGVLLFDQNGRPIIDTADSLPDGRQVQKRLPAILNAYPQSIDTFDEAGNPYGLSCPAAIGVPSRTAPSAAPVPPEESKVP